MDGYIVMRGAIFTPWGYCLDFASRSAEMLHTEDKRVAMREVIRTNSTLLKVMDHAGQASKFVQIPGTKGGLDSGDDLNIIPLQAYGNPTEAAKALEALIHAAEAVYQRVQERASEEQKARAWERLTARWWQLIKAAVRPDEPTLALPLVVISWGPNGSMRLWRAPRSRRSTSLRSERKRLKRGLVRDQFGTTHVEVTALRGFIAQRPC